VQALSRCGPAAPDELAPPRVDDVHDHRTQPVVVHLDSGDPATPITSIAPVLVDTPHRDPVLRRGEERAQEVRVTRHPTIALRCQLALQRVPDPTLREGIAEPRGRRPTWRCRHPIERSELGEIRIAIIVASDPHCRAPGQRHESQQFDSDRSHPSSLDQSPLHLRTARACAITGTGVGLRRTAPSGSARTPIRAASRLP